MDAWRATGYEGASDVTQDLFRFWFEEDHVLRDGRHWRYHFGQRESVETLAYLVEVAQTADTKDLVERFGEVHVGGPVHRRASRTRRAPEGAGASSGTSPSWTRRAPQDLPPEGLSRLAIKMATGSGKTVVMALVVAWSYFHRARVPGSPLSRNFLIVAPNVIVYQRLERDFASNRIFEELPIVPPGWTLDLKPILRGESAEPSPSGTLFLTNVQQIHESRERQWTPENAVAALLGPPVDKDLASHERSMLERIRSLPDLVAINDEAHHVHDEDLEWAKTLLGLKDKVAALARLLGDPQGPERHLLPLDRHRLPAAPGGRGRHRQVAAHRAARRSRRPGEGDGRQRRRGVRGVAPRGGRAVQGARRGVRVTGTETCPVRHGREVRLRRQDRGVAPQGEGASASDLPRSW